MKTPLNFILFCMNEHNVNHQARSVYVICITAVFILQPFKSLSLMCSNILTVVFRSSQSPFHAT